MSRRFQKNVTIPPEKMRFITANYGKMSNIQLAKNVNEGYGKVLNNLKLIGLHKPKAPTQRCYHIAKMVGREEIFDVDQFGRYYEW
jgi:hypothetical protein